MSQARRPKTRLAEAVTLTATAQDRRIGHNAVLDADLAVIAPTGHGFDIAHDLPSRVVGFHDEGGVPCLGRLCIWIGLRNHDGEARSVRSRDEPLVAVDGPVVASLRGRSLDAGGIGACNFRLGHRKARAAFPVDKRPQVLLLLLRCSVVEQRVHVALVGGMTVQDVGTELATPAFRGDECHGEGAESHAAPFPRHVGCPKTGGLRLLPQLLQGGPPSAQIVGRSQALLGRFDLLREERPDAIASLGNVRRKCEIDGHGALLVVGQPLPQCNRNGRARG